MTIVISVQHLTKHFRLRGAAAYVQAVNDVSLQIERGQTVGLVGESGSGKTTVGRCILRLIEPTSGEVFFMGKPVTQLSSSQFRLLRRKMQLVFQDPYDSLDPRVTVGETIKEPLRLWSQDSQDQQRERVEELVSLVNLRKEDLKAYPHQLSGGEQQRIGIARALACEPDFIVLDEPTSSLDPTAGAEIIQLLIRLQEQLRMSYLFISHDLRVVHTISRQVAVMYLSRVVEMGPTEEVFSNPLHPYSQALLSSVPLPDPTTKRRPKILRGEIPSPINLPTGCYLASRCPRAVARCQESYPPLEQYTQDHYASCFRIGEP